MILRLRPRDFPLAKKSNIKGIKQRLSFSFLRKNKERTIHTKTINLRTIIIITITLKVNMQLVALATALAFILVVFLNSPPYTANALYVTDEGIQMEHGGDRPPRDRSEILREYASNMSSGGANDMYPLKNFIIRATIKDSKEVLIPNIYKYGTYHNVLDVLVIKNRYHYGWYDNILDVLVDDTAYFNPQSGCWPTRPEVEWTITATNNRTDLIQYIRYLSYYPGINPWVTPPKLPAC